MTDICEKGFDPKVEVPHGPAFTLVHKVTSASALPDIVESTFHYTGTEIWTAEAHFPGNPIMPGVKMIQLMSECALQEISFREGLQTFLPTRHHAVKKIRDLRFRNMVKPGTELNVTVAVGASQYGITECICEITEGNKMIAEGTLEFHGVDQILSDRTARLNSIYTGEELWSADNVAMGWEMIFESIAQNTIQIRKAHDEKNEQIQNKLFVLQGITAADCYDFVLPGTIVYLKSMIAWDDFGRRGKAHCTAKNSSGLVARVVLEFACIPQRKK